MCGFLQGFPSGERLPYGKSQDDEEQDVQMLAQYARANGFVERLLPECDVFRKRPKRFGQHRHP